MHRLFVDDTREFPKSGYECCRDADTAMVLLSIMEFEHISLDYDLGSNCPSGLDILYFIKENNIFVPEINIHSNHIFGKEKMYDFCIENFPRTKVSMHTLQK